MTTVAEQWIDSRAEQVDLVKTDYEATRSVIDGVVRTSIALRGIALTLVLALLTFAIDRSSIPIAACALAAAGLFLYLDAYHGWLYAEGLRRAHELEKILALRYKELERGGVDPDISIDLDIALAQHRFGQYSNFPRFRLKQLRRARPVPVFAVLYGGLSTLAVAAIIYLAVK